MMAKQTVSDVQLYELAKKAQSAFDLQSKIGIDDPLWDAAVDLAYQVRRQLAATAVVWAKGRKVKTDPAGFLVSKVNAWKREAKKSQRHADLAAIPIMVAAQFALRPEVA